MQYEGNSPFIHRLGVTEPIPQSIDTDPASVAHSVDHPEKVRRYEKRRLIVDALQAFRESQKQWSTTESAIEYIRAHGPIPVDQWWFMVLYGKDGYYSSGRAEINVGDAHFFTVVNEPRQVGAFYFALSRYLRTAFPEENNKTVVSAASGMGDFEEHFYNIHKHASTVTPENALATQLHLCAVDVSENNLLKQASHRNYQLDGFVPPFYITDTHVAYHPNETEPTTWIEIERSLLLELCTTYDCVGELLSDKEYRQYYQEFIRPFLCTRIDSTLLSFIDVDPSFIRVLAPNFTRPVVDKVVGSAFDLPFAAQSVHAVFSNELHDAFPSKVFVTAMDFYAFEELYVGYDAAQGLFTLESRPVSPQSQALLDVRFQEIKEKHSQLPFSPELAKRFLVVNTGTLQYMAEAARVLKPGGVLMDADYTQLVGDEVTSGGLRVQTSSHWHSFFEAISDYKPPWLDVTTDMDPCFMNWVADALDLELMLYETQENFCLKEVGWYARMANPATKVHESFKVLAYRKKT